MNIPARLDQQHDSTMFAASLTRSTQTLECFGRTAEVTTITRLLQRPATHAGVLLAGPSGVGKTRLAQESLRRLSATHQVIRINPSPPEGMTELHLGDTTEPRFPPTLCKLLTRQTRGDPALIAVDDAHLLSPATAGLLLEVALSRRARLLVAVNTDNEPPPSITALWKDDHLARIDVGPLDTEAARRMAAALLDHKLAHNSAAQLARMSAGNPLLLRELVRASVEEGLLTLHNGKWIQSEGFPVSAPLRHLLDHRIRRLDPASHNALELVLLGEPLPLDVLEQLADPTALIALEKYGLISAHPSRDETSSDLAALVVESLNPLVGHAVLQDIPLLRRRHHLRTLADTFERMSRNSPRDRLRTVIWHLDSGNDISSADLMDAARYAHQEMDLPAAAHLSAAAWRRSPSAEAAALHATVLISLAEPEDAFHVLDTARCDFPDAAELDVVRVHALLLQGHLDSAEELATSLPGNRGRLSAAATAHFRGGFDRVLELCEPLVEDDAVPEYLEAAIFRVAALCHAGRPLDALAQYEETVSRWGREAAPFVRHEGFLEEVHATALHYAGRMAEARNMLHSSYESAVVGERIKRGARRGLALGGLLLEMGRPGTALPLFSLAPAEHVGWKHWHDTAAVFTMLALATLPDTAATQRASDQLPAVEPTGLSTHAVIAHAWAATARSDTHTAISLLVRAAQAARANGGHADVAFVAHAMGRLGLAVHTEDFWDTTVQGPYLQARLDYSRSLATKDIALLRGTARAFTDAGAELYAAEAYAELSRLYRRSGNERAATAAQVKAREIAARCQGAVTPPLHALDEIEPLTSREREIALLAARGLADKEIAGRLTLSIRTVGNHLYRIYRKLGVTSRQDLRIRMEVS